MSKEIYDKIVLASKSNKSICISINGFVDLLKSAATGEYEMVGFETISDREMLKTGLYAKINDAKCFVSPIIEPGCMRVSNLENPPATAKSLQLKLPLAQEEDNIRKYWSAEVSIAEYGDDHANIFI